MEPLLYPHAHSKEFTQELFDRFVWNWCGGIVAVVANVIENKRARFDYEILETFEAGIELLGFEVKALRQKRGNLEGAFVVIRGREAFLLGARIPPYQSGNTPESYDETRPRKLLLNKEEIGRLAGAEGKKGLTIVPIFVYTKGRKLKLHIAVVRGKKKFDKREAIKRREDSRKIERILKRGGE